MSDIKSIVVLDLETSGLPAYNTVTRTTEISLTACEVEHLLESQQLPRVLHKLVLCINPKKKLFPQVTECSGLDNEMLQNLKPFGPDIVEAIKILITRVPEPVCLIAHNGNKFDFPILRKEIKLTGQELPRTVYCADSLLAFREIFPKSQLKKPKKSVISDVIVDTVRNIALNKNTENDHQSHNHLPNKSNVFKVPQIVSAVNVEENDENQFGSMADITTITENDILCCEAINNVEFVTKITPVKHPMQIINETTPKRKIGRRLAFEDDSPTIENFNDENSKRKKDESRLTYDLPQASIEFLEDLLSNSQVDLGISEISEEKVIQCPKSYKLCDIFSFLHKRELINAHRAEVDTLALLSSIAKTGEPFIEWVNRNKKPFQEMEPLV